MKFAYVVEVNKEGSPLLFNYVMDYCVDGLIEEDAIKVDSLAVTHLAFTDDIVVFSDTTEGLQRQLYILSTRLVNVGSRLILLNVKH